MPFLVPAATTSMISTGSGLGILGTEFSKIANAVSTTCASVFSLPGTVTVTASGAAGAGVVAPGSVITGVEPSSMSSAIVAQMASVSLVGAQVANQSLAISTGIISGLAGLVLTGPSPGVGTGVGTGKIVNFNNVLFGNTLYTNMASQGMVGEKSYIMAVAIGNGVCLTLNAAGIIPIVTIAGPAGPAPGATVFPAQFI